MIHPSKTVVCADCDHVHRLRDRIEVVVSDGVCGFTCPECGGESYLEPEPDVPEATEVDGDDVSLNIDLNSALESLQNHGIDFNSNGDILDLSAEYGIVNDFISMINNNQSTTK